MKRYEQCILATCTIPWDENYNFMEDIFRNQIRNILQYTRHIYIFGTAGEGYAVSDSLFTRIAKVFCNEMQTGQAEPMIGIISLSLLTVIERIECAYNSGVRNFQISLPAWGTCNFKEIKRFFKEVCGRFEDCSFLHYNLSRSKRLVSPEEYSILAGEFPNLAATKNGAKSSFEMVLLNKKAPRLRHFYTEHDFAAACLFGLEPGLLISIASINWQTAKLFYQAGIECRNQDIVKYISELSDISQALFRFVGDQGHIDGAYDKMFPKLADGQFPLRLLPPYNYADDNSFAEFEKYIQDNQPSWSLFHQRQQKLQN